MFAAAALFAASPLLAANESQRLEERLPAAATPSDRAAPAPVTLPGNQAAALASFPQFTLRAVAFEGVTALSPAETKVCIKDLRGKTVGAIEVTELTQCVTQLYRERGFFLSRAIVPPQEVIDGTLRVRAIEGYVASIAPTGIAQVDADAQFADALAERPTRLATFERALLLLSDRYGHRVTSSQLAPDPNDPARFTFQVAVAVSHVSWRVYADNRGTEAAGPEQLLGLLSLNDMLGNDRLSAQLFVSPTDVSELTFGDINYARAWSEGLVTTELGASVSHTRDGSRPEIFAAVTEVERYYGRITVPVLRARAQSLWIHLAFDGRDTEQYDPIGPDAREATRAVRAGATYTRLLGDTRLDAMLELARGLHIFGASRRTDTQLTRDDARPQFTKVRLDASAVHKLNDRWEVSLAAAGQLADGALVAAEEFGGGGARFGRAYDYSEIIGDSGIAGAAELRWNWPNALETFLNVQFYGFADAVRIWNTGADTAQLDEASLSSAGGGIRVIPVAGVLATIEIAKPLSRDVAAEGDRSPRIFVSLSLGW